MDRLIQAISECEIVGGFDIRGNMHISISARQMISVRAHMSAFKMSVFKLQAVSGPHSSSLTFIFFFNHGSNTHLGSSLPLQPGNHLSPGEVRFADSEKKTRMRGEKRGGEEFSSDAAEEELQ